MHTRKRGHQGLPGIERSQARRDDDFPYAGIARHQLHKPRRTLLDGDRVDTELGESFDAAELSAHADLVPDAIGQRYAFDRCVTGGESAEAPVERLVRKRIPGVLRHSTAPMTDVSATNSLGGASSSASNKCKAPISLGAISFRTSEALGSSTRRG